MDNDSPLPSAKKLMETALGFRESALVLAAVKLNLFEKIGTGKSRTELSELDIDNDALDRLCRALVSLGLLEKNKHGYACPPDLLELLTDRGDTDLRPILRHFHEVYEMWGDLPDVLRRGQAQYSFRDDEDTPFDAEFLEAMEARAHFDRDEVAEILARRLDSGRLLDLAGGSGVYSRAIMKENQNASATVADLAGLIDETEKYIREDDLGNRMNTRAVDLLEDEQYGNNVDMILLSAVLHMFGPDQCQTILSRCFRSLRPGGTLVIRDYVLDEDTTGPTDAVLFDIMMLLATDSGRNYTETQYREFLETAGFEPPERTPLSRATDDLLIARKPLD